MKELREFLEGLGYDTSCVGCNFFIDLLEEVVCMLQDGKNDDEIKELIPCLYIEHYHFVYEISRFKYLEELEKFCRNGYILKNKLEKKKRKEPIEDKVLRLSKKYYNKMKTEKRNIKVYKLT